ncbi:hypothetical protein RSAG8_13823, partial [Rhizoctonia solani AG-8 WAC10335]
MASLGQREHLKARQLREVHNGECKAPDGNEVSKGSW